MTFERALEVEFLQPLHRGGSDAGSVLGDSSGRAHGAPSGPAPGVFVDWRASTNLMERTARPLNRRERLHRAMRSAVEEQERGLHGRSVGLLGLMN